MSAGFLGGEQQAAISEQKVEGAPCPPTPGPERSSAFYPNQYEPLPYAYPGYEAVAPYEQEQWIWPGGYRMQGDIGLRVHLGSVRIEF